MPPGFPIGYHEEMKLALLLLAALAARAADLIIDTDAGTDDFMAIAYLLARGNVKIEAVTLANGLAHPGAGAENVLRLLELAGRRAVPVYIGRDRPMRGSAAFPAEWRKESDRLGARLANASRKPERESAGEFLARRLKTPARMLALGPLTNLGEAIERGARLSGSEITIMGGAVRVAGNLGGGGAFKTNNTTAEWNLYVDPHAASLVFGSGARIRLVPLDATNRVKMDLAFLKEFAAAASGPLGNYVREVLESERDKVVEGYFYAWDPLAAVSLTEPGVCRFEHLAIEVKQHGPEAGRTAEAAGKPANAEVALDADGAKFRHAFLRAFARARGLK